MKHAPFRETDTYGAHLNHELAWPFGIDRHRRIIGDQKFATEKLE